MITLSQFVLTFVTPFTIDFINLDLGQFQINFNSESPLALDILKNEDVFLYSGGERISAREQTLKLVDQKD